MAGETESNLPSDEEKDELLLSCRYGDLEDVQAYVHRYSPSSLVDVADDNGNTILHMVSANGHLDVLSYILSLTHSPSSLLISANASGSTPLHWAALNSQLEIAKALVEAGGAQLIDVKNKAGRSPLGEAENAGWDDGARYFVSVMELGAEDAQAEDADEKVEGPIEVTIEDAEGRVATMSIGDDPKSQS